MCSSLSSTGNDLGVWYFNRDECWACLSVHFYNPQFTSGNEETLFYDVSSTFINKRIERKKHDHVHHGQFHCPEVVLYGTC